LHPDTQRRLALGLVRAVRAGLFLFLTTHSDYFLQQLSNFLRLGARSKEDRLSLGYTVNDFLKPEDVAAYELIRPTGGQGTQVRILAVSSDNGIAEGPFPALAEELYDESVKLQNQT
jgi:hypothetical protein